MASAPPPGAGRRAAQSQSAQKVATITVRGETYRLAVGSVPIGEKLAVLSQTGVAFDQLIGDQNKIGEVSVAVLWWLAKRANGHRSLSWAQVADEWPTDLTEDDVSFEMDTPDEELQGDDSPEA